MQNPRKWPTRRFQMVVIAVLAVGALLQAFMPPLTKQGRAERLYTDAWFIGYPATVYDENDSGSSVAIGKLEAALRLEPGNSRYEQALVWLGNRSQLPALLKRRKLGPQARLLAYALIFRKQEQQWTDNNPYPPTSSVEHSGARAAGPSANQLLAMPDEIEKADPSNALPHYQKACILNVTNRSDGARAEVEAGNRLGTIRRYTPQVDKAIGDSILSPEPDFSDLSRFRELARMITDAASDRLRRAQVDQACRLLEDGCQMGVTISQLRPQEFIAMLAGEAVFTISASQLEPVYKDFAMKNKVAALRSADHAFQQVNKEIRADISNGYNPASEITRNTAAPLAILAGAVLSMAILLLAALFWIGADIARKRGHEQALTASPWGEGWLARIMIAIFVPVAVVLFGIVLIVQPKSLEFEMIMTSVIAGGITIALGQIRDAHFYHEDASPQLRRICGAGQRYSRVHFQGSRGG